MFCLYRETARTVYLFRNGSWLPGALSYDESALVSASAASGEMLLHSPAGYHYRISQLNCGELRMGYTLCIVPENALPSGRDELFIKEILPKKGIGE